MLLTGFFIRVSRNSVVNYFFKRNINNYQVGA